MPAKKRSSPFVRPKPLPFRWTPRDAFLLTRVWEDKILTSTQLSRIFYGSSKGSPRKRSSKRLRTLYSHHLLDRHFLPLVPSFHGRTDALYTIGKRGVPVVAEKRSLPPDYIHRTRQKFAKQLKSYAILLTLSHIQALSDVRIAFENGFAISSTTQLLRWIPERLLEQRFSANHHRVKLRPAGLVIYTDTTTNKTYSAYIEVDRGTESHRQIGDKVQRYLAFSQTDLSQKQFGSRFFRVIFISPSDNRSLGLKSAIEKLTDKIFWLTEADKLTGNWLNQPIFRRVGFDDKYPLID